MRTLLPGHKGSVATTATASGDGTRVTPTPPGQAAREDGHESIGVVKDKGLTLRTAQQHVPRLLDYVARGQLDPSYLETHRFGLDDGPRARDMFKPKLDGCVRVVFAP